MMGFGVQGSGPRAAVELKGGFTFYLSLPVHFSPLTAFHLQLMLAISSRPALGARYRIADH